MDKALKAALRRRGISRQDRGLLPQDLPPGALAPRPAPWPAPQGAELRGHHARGDRAAPPADGLAHEAAVPDRPAQRPVLARAARFPASRGYVQFRGSQMLFEYYVGKGLQLQPLANFKKANALHGACVKPTGVACNRTALARLLDEMVATRVRRGRFTAYEYYFDFGGRPPWISGMATATGIQAFGRAGQLLNTTKWRRYVQEAYGAFTTPAPTGVLTRGPLGGTHYLQYSFASRLYIINALLQSVIGLYDYAEITGDPTAARLWRAAEPEARRELPANDTGDWSTYSFRGRESTREYYDLLLEFAAGMCHRTKIEQYCTTTRNFRNYIAKPATLTYSRAHHRGEGRGDPGALQRGQAVGGPDRDHPRERQDVAGQDRHVPPRRAARSPGSPAPPAPTASAWPPRSCAPARACARAPTGEIDLAVAHTIPGWRLRAPSSTPARAVWARRPWPPPRPAAARPPACGPWCCPPTRRTACRTRWRCRWAASRPRSTSNLFGQELQAQEEMERHWEAVSEWLGRLLTDQGVDRISAEELTVPPGMDELFSLLRIKQHHDAARVRRGDRGLRPHRRDAAAAVVPRRLPLVAGEGVPVAGQADGRGAAAGARGAAAGPGGVRRRGAPGAQPRGHERDPARRLADVDPAGDEPRPDGGARVDAHVHLPQPVRLPDRRRGGEPGAARGGGQRATSRAGARPSRSTWSWCARRSRRCRC